MKRTRLWRRVAVIIMGLFLLAGTACGKKGDPLPPEQPKAKTGAGQPAGTAAPVPAR